MAVDFLQRLTVERVNTLAGDKPQYRLGDAVLLRHTSGGMRAFEQVLNSPHYFSRTVLYDYAATINRNDSTPQWPVLKDVAFKHSQRPGFTTPHDNELVVHLRMGDTKGYKGSAEAFASYVLELVERSTGAFTQVTVVTAIHFGESLLRNKLSSHEVSVASRGETRKILEIVEAIASSGIAVNPISHQEIDRNFCYLTSSRHLVLGNGLFSLCAAMVSGAQFFMPPWIITGSAPGDEVLQVLRLSLRERGT